MRLFLTSPKGEIETIYKHMQKVLHSFTTTSYDWSQMGFIDLDEMSSQSFNKTWATDKSLLKLSKLITAQSVVFSVVLSIGGHNMLSSTVTGLINS